MTTTPKFISCIKHKNQWFYNMNVKNMKEVDKWCDEQCRLFGYNERWKCRTTILPYKLWYPSCFVPIVANYHLFKLPWHFAKKIN